jgi:hypothetical protein
MLEVEAVPKSIPVLVVLKESAPVTIFWQPDATFTFYRAVFASEMRRVWLVSARLRHALASLHIATTQKLQAPSALCLFSKQMNLFLPARSVPDVRTRNS